MSLRAEIEDADGVSSSGIAAVTCALLAIGAGMTLVGVRLSDSTGSGHAGGSALVAAGTAVVGGAVVAGLLGWVQARIDDDRATRDAHRTERFALELTLLTTIQLDGIDLAGFDLSGRYLAGRSLRSAWLGGASLIRANLEGADLTDADLTGADLTGAELANAVLSGTDLTGATMRGAQLPPGVRESAVSDQTTVWPDGY